ncbi:MAG: acetate--CoA ligase, partial [Nitrospira sp.]|nr:acetate--CoA ligase [Nitrospira sp.]
MPWNPIIKSRRDWETIPNLYDYESVRKEFSWEQARAELDGLPEEQGLNIAHEAVVRHASGSLGQQTAIRWLGKSGQVEDYSYARLDA